jgi:hypothetical protein
MKKGIIILFCILGLVLVTGCTNQPDILYKKNFNTFNSYFANGLSCSATLGLSLTGTTGTPNRKYTVLNFPMIIVVDTFYLNNAYDYTVTASNGSFIINFNNPIWNDQEIGLCLATSNTTISNSVYLGNAASGLDGASNRVLNINITNPLLISVDNMLLTNTIDYSFVGNNVTFINKLYNDMVISVWG